MAGHLLCGQWDHLLDAGWSEERVATAVLQASLSRAAYRCGTIDGQSGPATLRAWAASGISLQLAFSHAAEAAYQLPTDLGEDLVLANRRSA